MSYLVCLGIILSVLLVGFIAWRMCAAFVGWMRPEWDDFDRNGCAAVLLVCILGVLGAALLLQEEMNKPVIHHAAEHP